MSTTQYSPQLRPLSVGEVLDASFKIVRQSFGTLAGCVLVVALPLNIINTLITASTSDNAFNLDSRRPTRRQHRHRASPGLLVTGAAQPRAHDARRGRLLPRGVGRLPGRAPTVGESLSFAASRVLPLIVARRSSTSSG